MSLLLSIVSVGLALAFTSLQEQRAEALYFARMEQLDAFERGYGKGSMDEDQELLEWYVNRNRDFLAKGNDIGKGDYLWHLTLGHARLFVISDLKEDQDAAGRNREQSLSYLRRFRTEEKLEGTYEDAVLWAKTLEFIIIVDERLGIPWMQGARARYLD